MRQKMVEELRLEMIHTFYVYKAQTELYKRRDLWDLYVLKREAYLYEAARLTGTEYRPLKRVRLLEECAEQEGRKENDRQQFQ